MTVLVVDGNPLIRRIVHAYLARIRYDVVEAANEPLAADILRRQQVPILLTAWPMPGGDGVALLRHIRSSLAHSYTYVILLSDRDQQTAIVEGLKAGADDYLLKPLNLRELRRRVMLGRRIHKIESRIQQLERERDNRLTHDSLTGVLSRQAIYSRAEAELARYERDSQPFSLVMLGLDQLDVLNRRYSYTAGDQALRLVADSIMHTIRHHDAVGRWSGSAFLLVLPETTAQSATIVAERIHRRVAMLNFHDLIGQRLHISVSLAVASIADGVADSLPALVQHVDGALAQAKARAQSRIFLLEREL